MKYFLEALGTIIYGLAIAIGGSILIFLLLILLDYF